MMSEIVKHTDSLPEKVEWAKTLASSNLLPRQYKDNPANLLFAVEYADALGVARMNAITSIHVIEGKPSASADLIASLVRRAGHKLRLMGDDTYAEAHLIRADDPDFTYKARWDMKKAQAAGLTGKGVWKSYPGAMLRARAITEVARMGASDALLGMIYSPEELGAEVDASGNVVHRVTQAQPAASSGADRMREMLGSTPPQNDGGSEGSRAETPGAGGEAGSSPAGTPSESSSPDPITAGQIKKLGVAMREAGLTERAQALSYVAETIGREVSSRNELTKDEASRVIDRLESSGAGEAAGEAPEPAPETPTAPDADGVVDGEIVEPDPDAVWQQVVAEAGRHGYSLPDLEDDVKTFLGGTSSAEASGGELQEYLEDLRNRPIEGVA